MKLYKTKRWPLLEVDFLQLSCSCFGIFLGAYFYDFSFSIFGYLLLLAFWLLSESGTSIYSLRTIEWNR